MNIWIVNQYAVPPDRAGPPRHFGLASELVARGHDVVVVAADFDHHGERGATRLGPSEHRRMESIKGVSFLWLRVPAYHGNSLDRVWSMARFGVDVRGLATHLGRARPDVVIGSSPHLFGAFGAQRLARRLGVPFVLEVRDLWPDSLVALGGYAPTHPVVWGLARIERYLYRAADGIVAVLPGTVDTMVERGARRDRIVLVPNGVSLDCVSAPAAPRPHDSFVVAYAGSHGIANALDTVLDAAKLLEARLGPTAFRFEFIGNGVEKRRLQDRARDEGMLSVVFHDAVAKDRLYERLAPADAFVVSSRPTTLYRHGVSFNKFFDYLALSRPIVAGLEAFNDPIAEAGAGYTVAPGDPEAMANAFARLRDEPPSVREEMGALGRRYVEKNHDMRRLAARLERNLLAAVRDGGSARTPGPSPRRST